VPAVYVDTSALARVLLDESDAHIIERALGSFDQRLASQLLRVELRRVGLRTELVMGADQLLTGVALVPIDDATLAYAESIEPTTVATLDAIHLATAVRLARADALDAVMTYDKQLADGARHHGIDVVSPS